MSSVQDQPLRPEMKARIFIYLGVLGFHAFSNGVVELLVPGAREPFRLVTFAADGMLILAGLIAAFHRFQYTATKALIAFLLFSLLTYFYNLENVTLGSSLNGMRQPLVFLCALIVAYDILDSELRGQMVQWMHRFLFVFVLLQIPISYRQFSVYGASDWVGGTLGYGGSGILTQVLFLIAFYLVMRFGSTREFTGFSFFRSVPYMLVLIPCALNETKVAFVFLAIMVFLLAFTGNILRALPLLAIGTALVLLLGYYYSENVQDTANLFDPAYLERYLLHDSRSTVDVPRFQKVVMMFDRMSRDVPTYIVGFGYGIFAGGNVMETSEYSRSLVMDFRGTRILLNSIWLQGGILAVLTFAVAVFSFVWTKWDLPRNVRSFRLFLVATLIITWFYNEGLLDRTLAMVVAFFLTWVETGGFAGDEAMETGHDMASDDGSDVDDEEPSYVSSHARGSRS